MVGQVPPPTGGVTEQVRLLVGSSLGEKVALTHVAPGRDERCRGVGRLGNSIRLIVRVMMTCFRVRPDIAHLHTSSHLGFHEKALLSLLLRWWGVRVALHLHGGGFAEFYSASRAQGWIRRTLERSAVVLALSEQSRIYLRSIAPTARIEVLRNSVDLASCGREDGFGNGPAPARVLFLGALVQAKGIFKIPAIARGFASGEILFDVAGDGPEAPALAAAIREAGVEDRVRLVGVVHGAEKWRLLAAADVFLLPSDVEAQPVSILEAMASRAAVVGTAVGGVPELLADGRGVVCDARDIPGLTTAIRRLLADPVGRRRMAATAADYIREHHSLARQVGRLAAIYGQLMDGSNAGGAMASAVDACVTGGAS